MHGERSTLTGVDRIFSGDCLMKVGLNILTGTKLNSRIPKFTAID